MEKERDLLDDLFREKLQRLEADTRPEDWEAILGRLPGKRIPLRKQRWYRIAAAACIALLIGGGIIRNFPPEQKQPAPEPQPASPALIAQVQTTIAQPPRQPLAAAARPAKETTPAPPPYAGQTLLPEPLVKNQPAGAESNPAPIAAPHTPAPVILKTQTLSASAAPPANGRKKTSVRKWSFGTGIGGLAQGSGEVVNTYVLRSNSYMEDDILLSMNAASDQNSGKTPKTNIKHKPPVGFGFSVSRHLDNRFSLQSGLVYSLLISDWETQATAYNTKTRQTLHFIGIPLSLSYKITEWNRFLVYASAGLQADINVAGQLRVKKYSNDLQTGVSHTGERMKQWQWSANARAGISYPLIPHLSAFGEIGTVYYFNNRSHTETIYSDKAFHISPQIGFRLSF